MGSFNRKDLIDNINKRMLLNIDNPVYNTIIVFSLIMLLLYITKPDVIYDHNKREFRQFGTTDGKTLLPIYVVGILLAIILYVFFHYLSMSWRVDKSDETKTIVHNLHQSRSGIRTNSKHNSKYNISTKNEPVHISSDNYPLDDHIKGLKISDVTYRDYLHQQIQLQDIQNQLNRLIQQQMIDQLSTKFVTTTHDHILPNNLNV
jgi:hypothetical protein